MAAENTLSYLFKLSGLGDNDTTMSGKATNGQTPTAVSHQYRVLAVADTDEVLDLGDVSTVDAVIIRAIDYDLDIDTTYVASFNAEITVEAGEFPAIFKPSGTIRVKNNGAGETPKYEVMVVGRT